MSETARYRVLPNEPRLQTTTFADKVPLSDWERKGVKGLSGGVGCLFWGIICIVVGYLSGSALPGILVASIAIVLIAVIIKSSKISDLERKKAEDAKRSTEYANQSEIHRVESEAASLSSSLMRTYESSMQLAAELSQYLNKASRLLRDAESEYQANAFGPFWDAVEHAAQQLAAFNDKANYLSRNAEEYYRQLNGKKHTFPGFPVQNGTIPDPSPVVQELRRIVRIGQTNFQFANIWEHRRTREVLIAGFHTLGEAINNLGSTIEYSVSNLEQTVSSGLAKVVEEGIKTRDTLDQRLLEQNRMLDNIQHHRKPGVLDTPKKY